MRYSMVLHGTSLYSMVLHCTPWYSMVLPRHTSTRRQKEDPQTISRTFFVATLGYTSRTQTKSTVLEVLLLQKVQCTLPPCVSRRSPDKSQHFSHFPRKILLSSLSQQSTIYSTIYQISSASKSTMSKISSISIDNPDFASTAPQLISTVFFSHFCPKSLTFLY